MDRSESIFTKRFPPIYQALLAFAGVVVFSLVAKLVQMTGLLPVPQRFPWMSAAAFMLLFALFNSVFSLSSPNMMKYWGRSIYSFAALGLASGLFAWLLSSLTISEAGSYPWIYVVVSFGYLVFLSLMAFLRRVVDFAQREEWNQPRIRHHNKK